MSIKELNTSKNQPAPLTDIDLIRNTFTYVELAVALAKLQNCRISTAMLYITKVKKLGGYIAELEPNRFKIINLKKVKETLVGESQALEM